MNRRLLKANSSQTLPDSSKPAIMWPVGLPKAEDIMNLKISDIIEANDALIKNGVPSRAELYARNEITVLGIKVNLLPKISEDTFSIHSDNVNEANGPKAEPQ